VIKSTISPLAGLSGVRLDSYELRCIYGGVYFVPLRLPWGHETVVNVPVRVVDRPGAGVIECARKGGRRVWVSEGDVGL
jgi:hypothetical protein